MHYSGYLKLLPRDADAHLFHRDSTCNVKRVNHKRISKEDKMSYMKINFNKDRFVIDIESPFLPGDLDLQNPHQFKKDIEAAILNVVKEYKKPEKPPFPVKVGDPVFFADKGNKRNLGFFGGIPPCKCVFYVVDHTNHFIKTLGTFTTEGQITADDLDKYDLSEVMI